MSRLDLYREAWGYTREPRGRAIDYAMRRLREKLGGQTSAQPILQTIRGVGFRLVWSPVEDAAEPAPSPLETTPVAAPSNPMAPAIPTGRGALVQQAVQLLEPAGALVTLVGPGGIGKSTIARSVAAHRDHTVWIEIDGTPPSQVLGTIHRCLFASGSAPPAERILPQCAAVSVQPTLLIFNGAEQHLDLLAEILETIPRPLSVLVTSRSPIELPQERVLNIGPLDSADALRILEQYAGQLGVQRLEPDDCRSLLELLDGHPLAIQLAASKLATHAPASLAASLRAGAALTIRKRSRAKRHRSVEEVVQQALGRLNPEARRVLHDLTVFWKPFDRTAAGLVVDPALDVDEALEELLYTSMVLPSADGAPGHLRILRPLVLAIQRLDGPPVHGQRRLLQSLESLGGKHPIRSLLGTPTAPLRAAGPQLDAALDALPALTEPPSSVLQQTVASLAVHGAEQHHLRAVLEWLQERSAPDPQAVVLVANALHDPQTAQSALQGIAAPSNPSDARVLDLLRHRTSVLQKCPDLDAMSALADRAGSAGDHWVEAEACQMVAEIALLVPDLKRAESAARRAISAAQHAKHPRAQSHAWSQLGNVAFLNRNAAHAQQCLTEALDLVEANDPRKGRLLFALGLVRRELGDLDSVHDLLLQGLSLARHRGDLATIAVIMANLAEVETGKDNQEGALAWSERALQFVHQHMESDSGASLVWAQFCLQACKVGRFERAAQERQRWFARFGSPKHPTTVIVSKCLEAWIDAGLGNHAEARRHLRDMPVLQTAQASMQAFLLANAYIELGDWAEAEVNIARWTRPDGPERHQRRVREFYARVARGRAAEAEHTEG